MRLTDYFDCARIISLASRPDRRAGILRELARHQLALEPGRFELFDAIRPAEAAGFPSVGARGCYLSHLAVLRQALAEGRSSVLVMEDDLALSPDFLASEAQVLGELRAQEWGIVHLGHALAPVAPVARGHSRLRRHEGGVPGAHLFAVRQPVLQELVKFLEALLQPGGGPMHYDGALSTFRAQNPGVTTLIAQPTLATQRPSRSSITPRWFDRVAPLRALADLARRALRRSR